MSSEFPTTPAVNIEKRTPIDNGNIIPFPAPLRPMSPEAKAAHDARVTAVIRATLSRRRTLVAL